MTTTQQDIEKLVADIKSRRHEDSWGVEVIYPTDANRLFNAILVLANFASEMTCALEEKDDQECWIIEGIHRADIRVKDILANTLRFDDEGM
jgi:hypothetical protein